MRFLSLCPATSGDFLLAVPPPQPPAVVVMTWKPHNNRSQNKTHGGLSWLWKSNSLHTRKQNNSRHAQFPISVTFCLPVAVALTTDENDVRWENTGFLLGTRSRDRPLGCCDCRLRELPAFATRSAVEDFASPATGLGATNGSLCSDVMLGNSISVTMCDSDGMERQPDPDNAGGG